MRIPYQKFTNKRTTLAEKLIFLVLFFLILIIFRSWFTSGLITSGDFLYFSPQMMRDTPLALYSWDSIISIVGLSQFIVPYLWIYPYLIFPQVILGKFWGLDWSLVERVSYLYPYLILMVISPLFFVRRVLPKDKPYDLFLLIFSFNTVILTWIEGGEIFLGLAYALMPAILALFILLSREASENGNKKYLYAIITGVALAVAIMIDARISYVTGMAVALYFLFSSFLNNALRSKIKMNRDFFKTFFFVGIFPCVVAGLLHAFWIIPAVVYGKNPVGLLGSAYASAKAVRYLSFAKFEQTLGLLHPNWPESIFGKVGFMKPEFLLLPLIAFASLFFIKKDTDQRRKIILIFAAIGMVGIFLAKGSNEPFGSIYIWLFTFFPGFSLFRDSSKWYPMIALSYAVLIPYTLFSFAQIISKKKLGIISKHSLILVVSLFILLWCFTIKEAVMGQLTGALEEVIIPREYKNLEKFLHKDVSYSRVLWVPTRHRFGYYSYIHPAISIETILQEYDPIVATTKLTMQQIKLEELSVKYVIVPFDSQQELFMNDRKYDKKKYQKIVALLQKIPWLKQIKGFGEIMVFENTSYNDHIWSSNKDVVYTSIDPTMYKLQLKNATKGDVIVLSEAFDSHWIMQAKHIVVQSKPYHNSLTSFTLTKNSSDNLTIFYSMQKWLVIGEIITVVSLVGIAVAIIALFLKK